MGRLSIAIDIIQEAVKRGNFPGSQNVALYLSSLGIYVDAVETAAGETLDSNGNVNPVLYQTVVAQVAGGLAGSRAFLLLLDTGLAASMVSVAEAFVIGIGAEAALPILGIAATFAGAWAVGEAVGNVVGDIATNDTAVRWLSKLYEPLYPKPDPLVLDLDGHGVLLTALGTTNAHFDFGGDGAAELTGWVSPGDALLARDINGDGLINNGSELFGSSQQNGFAALAAFDANGDGRINASDPIFSQQRAWRDANQDGVSPAGELLTMACSANFSTAFQSFRQNRRPATLTLAASL